MAEHTMVRTSNGLTTRDLAMTGMMAALVFAGTYFLKIPALFGYTHLGDCMLVVGVALLGTKRGALAAAIGAAFSDLLGGYTMWVLPTFVIKGAWALILGFVLYRLMGGSKKGLIIGAVCGGAVQTVLYTLVKIPLYGMAYAVSEIPVLFGQSLCGVVFGVIIVTALEKAGVRKYLGGEAQK